MRPGKRERAIARAVKARIHRTPHDASHRRSVWDNPSPRGAASLQWGKPDKRRDSVVAVYS